MYGLLVLPRRFFLIWLIVLLLLLPSIISLSTDDSTTANGKDQPDFDNNNNNRRKNRRLDSSSNRPNILFLITDQQRYDAIRYVQDELSWYDNHLKINTPNIDKLISEGVYFRHAYCQCAVCAPARTSLRTGCTIERTGIQHNDLIYDYTNGQLFTDRVQALESIDHVLVDQYGYISEYYGKWHMPDTLFESKMHNSDNNSTSSNKRVVRYNDFNYTTNEFYFLDDSNGRKTRRYLDQMEDIRELFYENALKEIETIADKTGSTAQIDTYTKYPYLPIQLDSRYDSDPLTDLTSKNGFKGFEVQQPSLMGFSSLTSTSSPSHFTADVGIRALKRLIEEQRQSDDNRPWFLTISFHHPHPPFIAVDTYTDNYWQNRQSLFVPPSINDTMTNSAYRNMLQQAPGYGDAEKVQEWIALYYALVEEIDQKVGEILNVISNDATVRDNTFIIYTSDHGEMLGSHAKRDKNNFYDEASRVPLIMKSPGKINSGTVVDEMVSHLDVFSTILDYVGASEADNSDGRSLRPYIEGTEYNQEYDEDVVFAEWDFRQPLSKHASELDRPIDDRPCFLIRKGRYKLLMQKTALSFRWDMLFDMDADPFEMNNLLGRDAWTASDSVIRKAEHLRCLLLETLTRLDGDKGYFSDPAANYFDTSGDILEIQQRQRWKQIGFWTSENILYFGRLTRRDDGSYVRHEYLLLGTRKPENVRIPSIRIVGVDASFFRIDQSSLDFSQNDCARIRVTFTAPPQFTSESIIDAILILDVESPVSESVAVRLSLNNYAGPPTQAPSNFPSQLTVAPSIRIVSPPIIWAALDYSYASETSSESFGGCNLRNDGVDAQATSDFTCQDRDNSPCNIGWWDPGEFLVYRFSVQEDSTGFYNFRVRVAAFASGLDIGIELISSTNGLTASELSTVPALGYQNYTDIEWSIYIESGDHELKVVSNSGRINFCSVAVLGHNGELPSTSPTISPDGKSPTLPPAQATVPTASPVTVLTSSPSNDNQSDIPIVPFTLTALEYSSSFEKTMDSYGGCNNRDDGVDAQQTRDETCIVRDGSICNVGWWDPNEYLLYQFRVRASGTYVIRVRVAAFSGGKNVGLELIAKSCGCTQDSRLYSVPADGYQKFNDVTLDAALEADDYTLKVYSTTGNINLCSVSTFESDQIDIPDPQDKEYKIVIPGIYNAMYFSETDYYDSSSDRYGNCPVKRQTTIDGKINQDLICIEAISEFDAHCNIGWTDPGEYIVYNVKKPQGGPDEDSIKVSIRVAAIRKRSIQVELFSLSIDETWNLVNTKVFETPGRDSWDVYDTLVVWEDLYLGNDEMTLQMKITFLDGQTNLCSVGFDFAGQ